MAASPIEGQCNLTPWSLILRAQNTFHARKQLGFTPHGVVDPGGRTEYLIKFFGGSGPPPVPAASSPKELAKASVPLAMKWVQGARAYIQKYQTCRAARRAFPFDATAAHVHLHLDRLDDAACISRIREWLGELPAHCRCLDRATSGLDLTS